MSDVPDFADAVCPVCGATLELESCWTCLGEGGWHEDDEDTCVCLDPDELTEICAACHGTGTTLSCPLSCPDVEETAP